jgi:flagellin
MALSITNNIASLTAQQNLSKSTSALNTSLQRLSSGLKINSGADSPAGLVISNEQGAQIAGLQSAIDNTNQAVSLVQTGEGALSTVNDLLVQIRGLALSAANSAVNDPTALAADQAQIQNALSTIDRISSNTQFGTKKLLDGTSAAQVSVTSGSTNLAATSPVVVGPGAVAGTYSVSVAQQGQAAQLLSTNTFASANNIIGTAAAGTAITGLTVANTTNTGSYNVVVTQQGVKGSISGTGTSFVTGSSGGASSITIAGGNLVGTTTVALATTDNTQALMLAKLNAAGTGLGGTGYVASFDAGNHLVIQSSTYATEAVGLTVTADANGQIATGLQATQTSTQLGATAKVQISGSALTSPLNATANGAGLVNIVAAGNAQGLQFSVKPSGVGASTTVIAGTTDSFSVKGDSSLTLNGTTIELNAQNSGTLGNATTVGSLVNTIHQMAATTGVDAAASGSNLALTATKFGGTNFTFAATGASSGVVTGQGFFQSAQNLTAQIYDSTGTALGSVITGSGTTGLGITATGTSFGGANGLTFNFAATGSANGVSGTSTAVAGSNATATIADALIFQIGANQNQTASLSIQNTSSSQLGQNPTGTVTNANTTSLSKIDVTSTAGANDALTIIDKAISDISTLRGKLGAFQTNTLQATASNLQTTLTNTTAAQSVIRDTDFAVETANFTKNQVLVQAGTTVLANANATAQLILNLLK